MRARTGFGASVTTATLPPSPAVAEAPQSSWHSPVPYLFGGLAAMLGLIALALLILACSYLKLSGYLDDADDTPGGDGKSGEPGAKPAAGFVDQFVVIMAGEKKPTFLATPMSSRAASFGDNTDENSKGENGKNTSVDDGKKPEGGVSVPGGDPTLDQREIDRNQDVHQNQEL